MRKILTLIATTFVLGTMSFAQNDGEQRAIAAARSAIANDCLSGSTNVKVSVTENYNCNIFDGVGINRTIYFYSEPICPPGQICPLFPIKPIASVVVDCDYSVVSIECYKPIIIEL